MTDYSSLNTRFQQEAEECISPLEADCREVVAYFQTINSLLLGNGLEVKPEHVIELTKMAMKTAPRWPR
jgi:hypothetical protein